MCVYTCAMSQQDAHDKETECGTVRVCVCVCVYECVFVRVYTCIMCAMSQQDASYKT